MPIKKQETETSASSQDTTTIDVEILGNILFLDTPLKNTIVELLIQGPNGESLMHIGKTLTGPSGHFYLKKVVPASYRGKDIGVRICTYSTPSSFGKPFPIFFGVETFLLHPQQTIYNLGNIRIPLAWSFCDRPIFLHGKINQKNRDDSLFAGKTVQWQTPNGYILAETFVSIDGSYHIYTYGDGRIPEHARTMIVVKDKDKVLKNTEVSINAADLIYTNNIEIDERDNDPGNKTDQ